MHPNNCDIEDELLDIIDTRNATISNKNAALEQRDALLRYQRDSINALREANAALQQSLDEATARINTLSVPASAPNLINYPVRRLGRTLSSGFFKPGDVVYPTEHPNLNCESGGYVVTEVNGQGNIVALNGHRQKWINRYTWERAS